MTNNGYKMIKKCSKGQKAWKKIKKIQWESDTFYNLDLN